MTRRRLLAASAGLVWAAILALVVAGALNAHAAEPSPFGGKFELVPLFDAGHRPVQRNGHSYYAVRERITFRSLEVWPGQVTDLASIPRIVWPLWPPDGPWAEAAVFHDECYKSRGTFAYGIHPGLAVPLTRQGCDAVLQDGMAALGVGSVPRVIIWEAVRLFGGRAWGT